MPELKGVFMNDKLLVCWLLLNTAWDLLVCGMCTYLVFWRNQSGWWFVMALILCSPSTTLFRALGKRFGVSSDEDDEGATGTGTA